ncbi:MAG TPA: DUF697 domain-containing protein [Chitinophagales bacterium]|nr:DUF697 domain-containing protein [Chitinophagales bacterium]
MSKKEQAQKVVQNHMLFAGGAGLVPLPGLDLIAVTAVQIEMLRQLSNLYGKDFSENQIKNYISAITGGLVARAGASALKGIPVVGQLLGSATMAITSSATTYAIGQVFVTHYESGGSNEDFDVETFKKMYEQELKKGKEIAKKQQQANKSASTVVNEDNNGGTDIYEQIRRLGELKEKGLLSDEEFAAAKAKLLSNL